MRALFDMCTSVQHGILKPRWKVCEQAPSGSGGFETIDDRILRTHGVWRIREGLGYTQPVFICTCITAVSRRCRPIQQQHLRLSGWPTRCFYLLLSVLSTHAVGAKTKLRAVSVFLFFPYCPRHHKSGTRDIDLSPARGLPSEERKCTVSWWPWKLESWLREHRPSRQ